MSATISIAEPDWVESALGGEDQLRATVRRVGTALDVAERLELVDDAPDDLLVAAREAGQLGRPDTVLVEEGEHGAVTREEVVVAGLGPSRVEELVLQGAEQASREHAQIRVPFLPLPAPLSRWSRYKIVARRDGIRAVIKSLSRLRRVSILAAGFQSSKGDTTMTTTRRSNFSAALRTTLSAGRPRRAARRHRRADRRVTGGARLPGHRPAAQPDLVLVQRQDRAASGARPAGLGGGGPSPLPDGPRADDSRRAADAEALRDPAGAAQRLRHRPQPEATRRSRSRPESASCSPRTSYAAFWPTSSGTSATATS